MTNSYTLIPNTQVLHSKIDVLEVTDPDDEDIIHRVEITADNGGVYITACEKNVREVISIAHKDLAIATARCILEAYNVPYTL
jgi:predicted dinucleotide-utilizing enzyme